jgi:peptidoglycan/xylan/chitin deacetylase (PgdA/CDA1 family)
LRQIGIPFYPVDIKLTLSKDELAVLIINSLRNPSEKENILNYVRSGGAILTDADTAKTLAGITVKTAYIKYLSGRDSALFTGIPLCDLKPARHKISAEAQHLKNQNGTLCVAAINEGSGKIMVLPSGFCANRLSNRSQRKNFPREGGERFPNEKVSRVSGGAMRQIVQISLEHLFHFRGLPFPHLWQLPDAREKLFGFRVDTDFGTRDEVEALYRVCRKNNIRATWFVETKSPASWIKDYRKMKDQEIGYHCYRHRIFPDYSSNLHDIQQGLRILHDAGIQPEGYAAPFGEWHPALGKAAQDMGFKYSSEFAAGYNDIPFFPFLGDTFSSVAQVPIHPVSVGRLRWARHFPENMLDYYRRVIREKAAQHEPAFIYHHPGQGHYDLFDKLFQEVRQQDIPTMSLGEYANWWHKRAKVKWEAVWQEKTVKVNSDCKDPSIWINVCYPDRKTTLMPINPEGGRVKILPGRSRAFAKKYDPEEMRKYTWRMLIADLFWLYGKWKQ